MARVPLTAGSLGVILMVGWVIMAAAASSRPSASASARMQAVTTDPAAAGRRTSLGAPAPTLPGGRVRTYYIAADKVAWDYAPRGRNMITAKRFGAVEATYVKRGATRIGSTYLKSKYRRYTDATFTHRVQVSSRWRHLGSLGPVIQAEVGDTIVVHFKNRTPFPASMHPHGVRYAKDSEGAPYDDGTSAADKADDAVAPGRSHTYVWQVPERAGPGPGDGSSAMWMYHSHSDEVADSYAGLIGPLIVTRQGMANSDAGPKDVDREFVVNFMVANENHSPYLTRNIGRFARTPRVALGLQDDEEFQESNLMHSINGYVFGNGPMMRMRAGERVRWYVMSMGSEVDLHTPHWHGNVVTTTMGMRTDVLQLLAGTMQTADMQPDASGIWLFHCHINDHITAGMLTRFEVDS